MITIYGIKNCDTVRKALKWMTEQGIEHQFHDFRKQPLAVAQIENWIDVVGRDKLINTRGTTYRKLDDPSKAALDGASAATLLAETPTLMKRPIFEGEADIFVGFTDAEKAKLLQLKD